MITLHWSIIKEKLQRVRQKNFYSIIEAIKNLFLKQKRSIEIYILDLQSKAPVDGGCIRDDERAEFLRHIQIKILSRDEKSYFLEYLAFRSDILTRNFLEETLSKGHICFLALLDNQIVGATCLAFKEFPLFCFGVDFMLNDHQAYNFHSFVKKELRGMGIMTLLVKNLISYCYAHEFRFLIGAIYGDNLSSVHLYTRLGFKKYANIIVTDWSFATWRCFQRVEKNKNRLLTLKTIKKVPIKV